MKLIILDRDGVINFDSPNYIKKPEEWQAIPGSLAAIAKLNAAGYTVALATNQSGINRGLYTHSDLQQIHAKMQQQLNEQGGKIDHIVYCPHTPENNCDCRKPKPGLLQQIAEHYQIPLTAIPCIGDSLRDLEAAAAMGCRSVLVLTGNGKKTLPQAQHITQLEVFPDLVTAVETWLHSGG